MPNLKDIRKRIVTVRNTQQITKAMKMVAAAKLRRAQEAAENARPYSSRLTELLGALVASQGEDAHPFFGAGSQAPAHVVLLTSDRGLCGAYNSNLIRTTEGFLASEAGGEAKLTTCGRRGFDYFKKRIGERIVASHINLSKGFNAELAKVVAEDVAERFLSGQAGTVHLVYARFRSAVSQIPVVEQLLPVPRGQAGGEEGAEVADYVYEPDAGAVLASLAARYVETQVLQAMLEAMASEHGARMSAMDSASNNAADMIDRLTLAMNRARQASITTELMEIVGGAEALAG